MFAHLQALPDSLILWLTGTISSSRLEKQSRELAARQAAEAKARLEEVRRFHTETLDGTDGTRFHSKLYTL